MAHPIDTTFGEFKIQDDPGSYWLMYDFDAIIDRSESDSAKWRKYHGKDIIPMWVADMDFSPPPGVIEALQRRLDHGIFGYALPEQGLAEAVIAYLQRSFNWQIPPEWLVWLPGLVPGLNAACRATGEAEGRVLTTVPIYPPFLSAPRNSRRQLATTRMRFSDGQWGIDTAEFEATIDAETHLFILCNPHNPTGRVFTRDELVQLADICLKNDLTICSDEIHCDLVLDPDCRHIPMASLAPEIAQQTITLMAPSKTYNIPGLNCSFAIIANDSIRRRFKRAISGILPQLNVMGMAAAQAAYQSDQTWLEDLIRYLRNNRDLVCDTIDGIDGIQMGPIEATYLAWIDVRKLNLPQPAKWFERAGVGLSDGRAFDGEGYLRLNFGCSRQLLNQALNRISKAIDEL